MGFLVNSLPSKVRPQHLFRQLRNKITYLLTGSSILITLLFLFSYIFTRYSFDPQIANANRGESIFFALTNLF